MRLTSLTIEVDSLMTAITARGVATPAANTFLMVKLRVNDGLSVQLGRQREIRQLLTNKSIQLVDATLRHVVLHTKNEVVDDAIAVLHHSGTNLHVTATQLDKFQCIAPRFNSAYTTILYLLHDFVRSHLVDEAQGDRFHRTTRVARNSQFVAHC